jgi:hypothetical protein
MEDLLYYVWQQRIFTKLPFALGRDLEILDPGTRNFGSGPDFFNAKLKMGDTTWAGNVEMHVRATDWYRHHHDTDPAYNSVILHVVMRDDSRVQRPDGQLLMQVTLPVPDLLVYKYRKLTATGDQRFSSLTCAARIPQLPSVLITDWKLSLITERMALKTQRVRDLITRDGSSWQEAFYVVLCRAFGTGVNSDACERLARSLPYAYLLKHIDNPLQVEALILGQAGFLQEPLPADEAMFHHLQQEYDFLRSKFQLKPLPAGTWKMGGVRPQAAPPIRLATFAALLASRRDLFSQIFEARSLSRLIELLRVPAPKTADLFEQPFSMGTSTIHSLIINAIVPMLLAYGQWSSDKELQQRAMLFLESIPAEQNRYVSFCTSAGLAAANALDSQAWLHLYRNYCERRQCLRCRFGHWMMRH